MSHWFHRNPLKVTDFVKFELKQVLRSEHASKICGFVSFSSVLLYRVGVGVGSIVRLGHSLLVEVKEIFHYQ